MQIIEIFTIYNFLIKPASSLVKGNEATEMQGVRGKQFHSLHHSALGLHFKQQCPLTHLKIRNIRMYVST
jgi:hypothetical protein